MNRFKRREPIAEPKFELIDNRTIRHYPPSTPTRDRAGMDAKTKELVLISLLACLALAMAWRFDADLFAIFFAIAAAIAIGEAVHRSL